MGPYKNHPQPQDVPPWDLLAGRRVFLAGGTGFFGCNLLDAYTHAWERHRLNGQVSVLTRDPEAFLLKAPHLARHPGVEIIEGDLANDGSRDGSWDFVIHAAVEYGESAELLQRNLGLTERVLDLARRCGARRILFTSSGAVYGPQPPGNSQMEEAYAGMEPLPDLGAYAEAKRASERLGLVHGERHGQDFLIARCFAFLGSWLPLTDARAAGNFIADAIAGGPIDVKGDGRPFRSYLHGEDLADWLWTILLRGVHGRPYNVGSNEEISIAGLAYRIRDLLAPGAEVRIAQEPGDGHPPRYIPSIERARLELGLVPRLGLDEAILRTARWNQQRGEVG